MRSLWRLFRSKTSPVTPTYTVGASRERVTAEAAMAKDEACANLTAQLSTSAMQLQSMAESRDAAAKEAEAAALEV